MPKLISTKLTSAFRCLERICNLTALFLLFIISPSVLSGIIVQENYRQFSDSPFNLLSLPSFYLEDFENTSLADNTFETPGVSATYDVFRISNFRFTSIDSVDGDDGNIDGSGSAGGSLYNYGFIELVFDSAILGYFPSHAGLVWTDGTKNHPVTFEAFDHNNVTLGSTTLTLGDNSFYGTTAEDTFFGAINLNGGISKLIIHDNFGVNNLEIDHLQYGGVNSVPEPTSIWLFIMAMLYFISRTIFINRQYYLSEPQEFNG